MRSKLSLLRLRLSLRFCLRFSRGYDCFRAADLQVAGSNLGLTGHFCVLLCCHCLCNCKLCVLTEDRHGYAFARSRLPLTQQSCRACKRATVRIVLRMIVQDCLPRATICPAQQFLCMWVTMRTSRLHIAVSAIWSHGIELALLVTDLALKPCMGVKASVFPTQS